jgi:hypothetical protein
MHYGKYNALQMSTFVLLLNTHERMLLSITAVHIASLRKDELTLCDINTHLPVRYICLLNMLCMCILI